MALPTTKSRGVVGVPQEAGRLVKKKQSGVAMNTIESYCGVMDHSTLQPQDPRGVWDIVQNILKASQKTPNAVRHLNLSRCRFDLMNTHDHRCLATSVDSFVWLSVVKLNACGLAVDHMVALLHRLLCLPFMQGRNPAYKEDIETSACMTGAEISIQSNGVTDETLRLLSEKDDCFLRTSQAIGVQKLDLSYNKVTDKGVCTMAHLTPRLTHLYLNGNRGFTGTHMESHVTKFAPLSLLAMDKTGVDSHGLASLLAGLSKRKASDACPLELWMRSMLHPIKDNWCPLLDLCRAKVDKRKKFRLEIKHDLQNGLGHHYASATSQHDCVLFKIFLNGWQPTEVKHFDVPSDMAIARLAVLAVNEVTAVCLEDTKRPMNSMAMALRLRYAAALKHIVDSGTMFMKMFKVEYVRALYISQYTNEKVVVDGMGNDVLGAPKPGWDVVVEVAADEDTELLNQLRTHRR